jgi:hypothetical protein
MRGRSGSAKGARRRASAARKRHVVAMDHFGASGGAEDVGDVA